jgi:hypothetical protein
MTTFLRVTLLRYSLSGLLLALGLAPSLQAQNVGIGTTSPAQKLDVQGWVELGDENVTGSGTAGALRYNTGQFVEFYDGTAWQQVGAGIGNTLDEAYDEGGAGNGRTITADNGAVEIAGTDGLHVTGGSVGIGTASPSEELDVSGTLPKVAITDNDNSRNSDDQFGVIDFDGNDGTGAWIGLTADNGDLRFSNINSAGTENGFLFRTGTTDRMYIQQDGNVGIGTSSPTATLHLENTTTTSCGPSVNEDFESGFPGSWSGNSSAQVNVVTCASSDRLEVGGTAQATTRAWDYSSCDQVTVSFDWREGTCGDDAESADDLTIEYYDGSAWQTLTTLDADLNNSSFQTETQTISSGLSANFQLRFNAGGTSGNYDYFYFDNLSITGTENLPAARIVDGNQQAGRVLTSDANGNASWQDPPDPGDNDWVEGSGVVYNNTNNVGIGTDTPSDSRLQVDNNSSDIAVKAEGRYGPTNGYLGVQGQSSFDGNANVDNSGEEIGILGLSLGSSDDDNFGVIGISNHWGGRFAHETSGNFVNLGGSNEAIQIVDGNEQDGYVLTSDANGNATWEALPAGSGGGNTLDAAYDQGGAGAGRTITADNGAVEINGSGGLEVSGGGNVSIGAGAPSEKLHVDDGSIQINSGTDAYTLPSADAADQDYVMRTDGSGNVSWDRTLNLDGFSVNYGGSFGSMTIVSNGFVEIEALDGPRRLQVTASGANSIRVSYTLWDDTNTPLDRDNVTVNSGNSITIDDAGGGITGTEAEILVTEYSAVGDGHVVKIHGHDKANGWFEGVAMNGDF